MFEGRELTKLTKEVELTIADLHDMVARLEALATGAPSRAGSLRNEMNLAADRIRAVIKGLEIEYRAGFPASLLVKRVAAVAASVALAIVSGPLGNLGNDLAERVATLAQQVIGHAANIDALVDLAESQGKVVEGTVDHRLTLTDAVAIDGSFDATVYAPAADLAGHVEPENNESTPST